MVLGAVEEGALCGYEMAGEKDVAAEGGEEGVELGGGGWGKGWECACCGRLLARGCRWGEGKDLTMFSARGSCAEGSRCGGGAETAEAWAAAG